MAKAVVVGQQHGNGEKRIGNQVVRAVSGNESWLFYHY
jgi:hypothetical protein